MTTGPAQVVVTTDGMCFVHAGRSDAAETWASFVLAADDDFGADLVEPCPADPDA